MRLTSRPAPATLVRKMLLVLELWPGDPGPSELRVSRFDDTGTPHYRFTISGRCKDMQAAAEVLKTGYAHADVRYDVIERILP